MAKIDKLKDVIANDWGDSGHSKICICLMDYITSHSAQDAVMLTYKSIARECNKDQIDVNLLESITYLCGKKINVLKANFIYIDDDGEEYELDQSEIYDAQDLGFIVHPGNGQVVSNYEKHILIYFEPTETIIDELNNG